MSVARQHADWLKLIDISGPFLSLPVLLDAFPQGLDAHDPGIAARLRQAMSQWDEERDDPEIHRGLVRFVITDVLGYPDAVVHEGQAIPETLHVSMPEHGERLKPDLVLARSLSDAPDNERVLVSVIHPDQTPDRPLAGRRWKESPAGRLALLLRGTGTRVGLLTNGDRWMLVDAPREATTGFATWLSELFLAEPLTLRAFRSLIGPARVLGAAPGERLIDLLSRSAEHQQEVTDQLGRQVRRAVEILVQQLDEADRAEGGAVLAGVSPQVVYEAAVTVMMRLVFLFCAEERELLPIDIDAYASAYAVSPLRDELEQVTEHWGEEVLERRNDAWHRLLAAFRAVFGGVEHEDLRLPAYGGHLFDPDRFPFLEGRLLGSAWRADAARPLPIHNRTVLHLLDALQLLYDKKSKETQRLSFRALDIEQIGHVYEGLLDHAARRATETVVGLDGRDGDEPEVAVSYLRGLLDKGMEVFVAELATETGRTPKAIHKHLAYEISPGREQQFLVRCDQDRESWGAIRPFASLVRDDVTGYPVVFPEGSLYVTAGTDRRTTGTHYTPRSLTEPLVQHTLDPLVYEGPADGRPEAEWRLRSAREILALKVCDMACGSGAFLVQACRYLSQKLVEAWARAEDANPGQVVITPEGDLSVGRPQECLIPEDEEERLALARRLVADRCLYGVDKNEMAVEMAKLSLWLITLQKNRPFTFLDHAIRGGDSLLGVTRPEQITTFHLNPDQGRKVHYWKAGVQEVSPRALARAREIRQELESFPVLSPPDASRKAELLAEADAILEDLRLAADVLIGTFLAGPKGKAADQALRDRSVAVEALLDPGWDGDREATRSGLRAEARRLLDHGKPDAASPRNPLHWPLEFPEVFRSSDKEEAGFDALIGNPPFQGGQKITGALGTDYRDLLVEVLAGGQRGSADLCAYFFLRAGEILKPGGGFGLLATNTIAQGDTREVGLDQLIEDRCAIPRAISSRKWPGSANLEVAHVWVRKGEWNGPHLLDDRRVSGISPYLVEPGRATGGKPHRLAANRGKSFQGSIVLGMGFVLQPEEAHALIERDPRNKDVLFPYLNGKDLNSRPDQSASRWVINFHDWPLDREAAAEGYEGPVAADYSECLAIVREKVKPERDQNNRKVYRDRWWHYAEKRPELYATIAGMERVLVGVRHTKHHSLSFKSVGSVFSDATYVFATDRIRDFEVLQSTIHEVWAREHSGSLETRLRYSPSDCAETFPWPADDRMLGNTGYAYLTDRLNMARAVGELTEVYNLFHDPAQTAGEVPHLRDLHVATDVAVAVAYAWGDLALDHGFQETKQGIRFTISEAARREVLQRLLQLNHLRYEEEVAQGLHDKKETKPKRSPAKKPRRPKPPKEESGDLFG